MKLKNVALIALVGMVAASATAFALAGGAKLTAPAERYLALRGDVVQPVMPTVTRFETGSTVRLEARTGHRHLAADGSRETYLLLEVVGTTAHANSRAPLNMALVIDRSGSMEGSRLKHAIEAARGVVGQLGDGDAVSAISFDTKTRLVVGATSISPESRPQVLEALGTIRIGGDTCIACGIEHARTELAKTADRVNRIIVLSDGKANHGVRDKVGFTALAEAARDGNVAISTIGVGLDYNEETLSALAFGSNGLHHFVQDEHSLPGVLAAEAEHAVSSVASRLLARIELADDVELLEVYDRAFERDGRAVNVQLGALASGEQKTVLLRLRTSAAASRASQVASVEVTFVDLVGGSETARVSGALSIDVDGEADDELDPLVSMRIQRSATRSTLRKSTSLYREGKREQAQQLLRAHSKSLVQESQRSATAARDRGDARQQSIDDDFERQRKATEASLDQLEKTKRDNKAKKAAPRKMIDFADPFGL